jgi:heat shock protein HslJ
LHYLRVLSLLCFVFSVTSISSAAELGGTTWRLVKISSMDDRVDTPDDRSKYTLEFQADGRAAMKADCNRGTGPWTSASANQLSFGPIAATRAMCPPGSLSDKYLAQFEWVRSYVIEHGHLFLATMADGSIVEFEPTGEITATVLGEELHILDSSALQEAILTRLFDRYAAEKSIEAEPAETDAFVEKMRKGIEAEGQNLDKDLTPEEAEQTKSMRRVMAQSLIRQWKINKALYDEFGGRVIYQQLGPEPLDAYRKFLVKQQNEGDFEIRDKSLEEGFWRYFTDDSIHDFMASGSDDAARAFTQPPWED